MANSQEPSRNEVVISCLVLRSSGGGVRCARGNCSVLRGCIAPALPTGVGVEEIMSHSITTMEPRPGSSRAPYSAGVGTGVGMGYSGQFTIAQCS